MATMATFGGVTFTTPSISAAAQTYFLYTISGRGPGQRLKEWVYAGLNGVAAVKFGQDGAAWTARGHVEGSTAANLEVARRALEALANGTAGTLGNVRGSGTNWQNCVASTPEWGEPFVTSGGRHCCPFSMSFRQLQPNA
jgi:hypothetical protein